MPIDAAIRRLSMRASYSAALLVALKSSCRTYFSCSPLGEMKRMPAPAPSSAVEVHDPMLGSFVG